jgi:DNA repair protein RecN (Recombination protein N)
VLKGLTRAYGEDADAVLSWAKDAAGRLAELDGDDDRLIVLGAERERLRTRLASEAGTLSAVRLTAARKLASAVTTELTQLAMPSARLVVEVRSDV